MLEKRRSRNLNRIERPEWEALTFCADNRVSRKKEGFFPGKDSADEKLWAVRN